MRHNITLEEQKELQLLLDMERILDDEKNVHIVAMGEIDKKCNAFKKRFYEILDREEVLNA